MRGALFKLLLLFFLPLVAVPWPFVASAARSVGPWTDLTVCGFPGWRYSPSMISDGHQGVIVAWHDQRVAANRIDIYVQRLNASGNLMWTPDGTPLCTTPDDQTNVKLAPDGEGGAYAAWEDARSGGVIYCQHVNRHGIVSWQRDGLPAAPTGPSGFNPRIVPDGSGRVLLIWEAYAYPARLVKAQLLNKTGQRLWGEAGITVASLPLSFHGPGPSIVSDGHGGAFVAWTDKRSASWKAVAQRLGPEGELLWPENGTRLATIDSDQHYCVLGSDGAGGAIAVWKDSRGSRPDRFGVFAQRVDEQGRVLWNPEGINLDPEASSDDLFPEICADEAGVLVAWHDDRTGDYDIHAQLINLNGRPQWGPNGTTVCQATGDQLYPVGASVAQGAGAFAWLDFREGGLNGSIYSQFIDGLGTPLLTESGKLVGHGGGYFANGAIAADERGGAFVAWADSRHFPQVNITAQWITNLGKSRHEEFMRAASGPTTIVTSSHAGIQTFEISLASASHSEVTVFDVQGRFVRTLFRGHLDSGTHSMAWDGNDRFERVLPRGVYFVRVATSQSTVGRRVILFR